MININISLHTADNMLRRVREQGISEAYHIQVGDYMVRKLQKQFQEQVDPLGNPWRPLRPATITRKGHDRILYETGETASSPGYKAETKQAIVTVGGKAAFHQKDRPILGVSPDDEKEFTRLGEARIKSLTQNIKAVGRQVLKNQPSRKKR